ncbi:MAG: transporter substrate-binding domain-containing protein [Chloroflexota bacterium]
MYLNRYRVLSLAVIAILVATAVRPHLANLLETPSEPREVFHVGALRVGLDPSRPPFAFFTEDGQYVGLEVDLGRALADEIGVPVRFVGLGFDGLYDALKTNNVDVVIAGLQPAYHIDGNAAVYSTHYFDAGLVLVSEAGFEDMRDLPGYALAYEFGSPADAEAQRWLRRVRPFDLRPYELPEYALEAMHVGEADAVLVDAATARLYLREHPEFDASAEQITHAFYTVTLRNDRPDMLGVINDTLQQLYDDGTLDDILDEWL